MSTCCAAGACPSMFLRMEAQGLWFSAFGWLLLGFRLIWLGFRLDFGLIWFDLASGFHLLGFELDLIRLVLISVRFGWICA